MANKPLTVNRIGLIMQNLNQDDSIMEISRKYDISINTIKKYRKSLSLDGSTVTPIIELSDEQLSEQQLSPMKKEDSGSRHSRLKTKKDYLISQNKNENMNFQRVMEAFDLFNSLNFA